MPEQTYHPCTTIDPADAVTKPSARRFRCGVCDTTLSGGAAVWSKPVWHDHAECELKTCTIYCPHCDHLLTQRYARDLINGTWTMPVGGSAKITGRRTIEQFLVQHPEAKGVLQR